MENKSSFYSDFLKVQNELDAVNKNAKGYNYKYADLPSLWEAVRKIISDNKFIVYGFADNESVHMIAEHESGTKIESKLPLSYAKATPQDLGGAITYFRRYQIMLMFNVMTEDDDASKVQAGYTKQEPKTVTATKVSDFYCSECGADCFQAKKTTGELFWSCPNWKEHKAKGERWTALARTDESTEEFYENIN